MVEQQQQQQQQQDENRDDLDSDEDDSEEDDGHFAKNCCGFFRVVFGCTWKKKNTLSHAQMT